MTVIDEIAAERQRQIDVECWTPEHEDQHKDGALATAAACYALHSLTAGDIPYQQFRQTIDEITHRLWPWHSSWWKPKSRRRDLMRAGALIVAEIERLDRADPGRPVPPHGSGPDNL